MKQTGEFQNRHVAVIGVGRAGTSAARALKAAGARVTLYDPKPLESLGEEAETLLREGFELVAGNSDYPGIETADLLVPSPGVRADAPVLQGAKRRGIPIYGEIEVAYRLSEAPIVAITGTNGKSTTTAMCGAMLQGAYPHVWVGGNLAPGEPINSLAMKAGAEDIIVAEVSSFQLEQIVDFRPKAALLTNLTPDHMDRHRDMAEYAAAKARIFENQTEDDFAVLNPSLLDVPELSLGGLKGKTAIFSVDPISHPPFNAPIQAWVEEGWLAADDGERREHLAPVSSIPVPGRHNVENALAAGLTAWLLGAMPEGIRAGLEAFEPVAHRMETVATVDGVRYVNNSMCTNPAALVSSLLSFHEPTILISGGKNKNLNFSEAGSQIAQHAKAVVLIGAAAEDLAQSIGSSLPIRKAETLEEAVDLARSFSRPGDVVMLAPGCASFGMFHDFMDRGEKFVQAVQNLQSKDAVTVT